MRKKKRFYKVFQYIALLCALIIIIFPGYWSIVSSSESVYVEQLYYGISGL